MGGRCFASPQKAMKPLKIALTPTGNRRLNELVGVSLIATAGLLLLSLVSYRPTDPSFNTVGSAVAHNWAGIFGATLSDLLFQFEGFAAFCLPLMLGVLGVSWIRSQAIGAPRSKIAGFALFLFITPAVFGLLPGHMHWLGAVPVEGVLGRLLVDGMTAVLNYPGTCVLVATLLLIAVLLSTAFSFGNLRQWLAVRFAFVYAWRDRWQNWKLRRAKKRAARAADRIIRAQQKAVAARKAAAGATRRDAAPPAPRTSWLSRVLHRPQRQEDDEAPAARRSAFAETGEPASPEDAAYLEEPEPAPSLWTQIPRATVRDPEPVPPASSAPSRISAIDSARWESDAEEEEQDAGSISIGERADADAHPVTLTPRAVSGYRLPPSTLLHRSDDQRIVREDELREEAKVLVEKCAEFDVTGQVTQINPGPVVTTFEFRPEAGVKYSRVTGLADDLCLAMAAESILIERMAGKSTVGIQVPNHNRETIWLRDVVEDGTFAQTKFKLPLAMGKDINGRIVTADLATMPHVLIAGSTGSGKSVAINAMIMSVLFKTTPEQVRMILVDPKRVELGMYEGIPHLFTPIITEPKLAANALRNAVREMERRLKLLASRSVRNIDQYNKLFESGTPSMFEDAEEQTPLPYILIIIDELADLMMLDRANVEEAITRLAQMARAVGIHLVLATQRPSVDVITGLIKANVPTRISFRLATKVDSRTILDNNGAEALLGRGDMLFLPPGTSRLQRVHAPFVTEAEISAVVDFWKAQGGAEYVEAFLESPRDEKGRELNNEDGEEDDDDPLFNDAVRLVFEFGKASTSLIQRRLRVGYGRAAHLIDMMERDGLVGPADGSKPREILKSPDWLTEIESPMR
jgi:S-DNA-T family DNA segregation ATPase FtsK/SpoIIIE